MVMFKNQAWLFNIKKINTKAPAEHNGRDLRVVVKGFDAKGEGTALR